MNKLKHLPSYLTASAIVLAGNAALAQTGTPVPRGQYSSTDLPKLISTILDWALGIAGLLAVIYIIIGGFNYITSSGNKDKVAAGKNSIIYAIIGLLVVALAFAIKSFVITRVLGGTDITPTI